MRGRRGTALQVVMVLLAVLMAGGVLLSRQLNADIRARHDESVRIQALWLARSALTTGVTGTRMVTTPYGEAHVSVTGGKALVELDEGRAEAGGDPYVERYTTAR